MKILVTGGSGFIGSFLVPKLRALGHDVHRYEEYFFKSIGEIDLQKNHTEVGDIADAMRVRTIIKEINPEVIIHLAAMTSVAHSYANPVKVTNTNYLGTLIMAESARLECTKLKQFIFPSSAEVYGVNKIRLKKESNKLVPNSPYAIAKRASEDYLNYMRIAYDFPVTIFRPFNTYGRHDSHYFVVEKTIYQMLTRNNCKLGTQAPIRDFLYIDYHIDAYLKAVGNPKAIGETFNLSTGSGVTILEMVRIVKKLTGFKGKVIWKTMARRPLDIMHLVGDNTHLIETLGWNRPISLEKGLKKTIKFWDIKVREE